MIQHQSGKNYADNHVYIAAPICMKVKNTHVLMPMTPFRFMCLKIDSLEVDFGAIITQTGSAGQSGLSLISDLFGFGTSISKQFCLFL